MAELLFLCPHCKQQLTVPPTMLGQVVRCPRCEKDFQTPPPAQEVAPALTDQQPVMPQLPVPTDQQPVMPLQAAPAPGIAAPTTAKTNGMSIASLVLSLVGLVGTMCCCAAVCGPLSIIFGAIGLSATSKDPALKGRGMALAGIIIGALSILTTIAWILITSLDNEVSWLSTPADP